MKKEKILIVEDELMIALSLKLDLEDAGYEVLPLVATGLEAIEAIKKHCPPIVLLDIRLAGKLTGIDVASNEECRKLIKLLIFMTGYITPELKEAAMRLNPYAYLEKPLDADAIIYALNQAKS
jgi:1,2-diacylglycerol 3-beta-glucosyltransferase